MRKRVKFAAGAGATFTDAFDASSGRYVGRLELEFHSVSRSAISRIALLSEYEPDPNQPGMMRVRLAPVTLYCDRQNFGGFSKECERQHHGVVVRYPLWYQLGRNVRVCNARMAQWNNTRRFVDSREWIRVYVYLLSRGVVSSDLRSLFRQWARFLIWPRYEEIESQDDSQKAPDNRSETDT